MIGREPRFDGMFQPCRNFAFQQEPGSIMLTASLLALLETGEVKLDDMVDTYGGVWCVDDTVSIAIIIGIRGDMVCCWLKKLCGSVRISASVG